MSISENWSLFSKPCTFSVILSQVHDRVCQELYAKYDNEDHDIWSHCQFLTKINLSAEMLGIPEGYALSFPAAVSMCIIHV